MKVSHTLAVLKLNQSPKLRGLLHSGWTDYWALTLRYKGGLLILSLVKVLNQLRSSVSFGQLRSAMEGRRSRSSSLNGPSAKPCVFTH